MPQREFSRKSTRPFTLTPSLVTPLFLASLVLHGLLLAAPVPSGPEPPESPEEAAADPEEDVVDLLSISSLASPEVEAPPVPADAPPPQPAASVPPPQSPVRPTQPVVSEVYPEPLDPEPVEEIPPPPEETSFLEETPDPEPPAAFTLDAGAQQQLLSGLGRPPSESNFDNTSLFPAAAWPTLSSWSAEQQSCFFAQITENDYRLKDGATDLRFLGRNFDLVETLDIPRTFQGYDLAADPNGYCESRFYEVQQAGQPVLYLSLIGAGLGNPPSSAIVIFWSADPR